MHPSESNLKIKLNSSRIISLYEIHCSITYAGLLEGLPNRKMNKHIIERLTETAKDKIYNPTKPYIIKPKEILIEVKDGPAKSFRDRMVKEHGEEWELIQMPRIECIASFESNAITDESMGSNLTIAWFQEQHPMPIDEDIINEIKAIDWDNEASSFDY